MKVQHFEDNKLHKNKKGTPQGGIISTLLANIYLNRVDKAVMRKDGHFYRFGVRIPRYADDYILMANKIPEHCLTYIHAILERMELTVNTDKTHLLSAREASFDFLVLHFGMSKILIGKTRFLECSDNVTALRRKP